MLKPSHILFPYDFSAEGGRVVLFVRALAERLGARVTLLSVVHPAFDPLPQAMGPLHAGDDAAQWTQALQHRLDQTLNEELAGISVARVALSGDPAIRIVDFAQPSDIDLIMMPTHGLGLFRNMLIGSVTAKVLHDATCPVWTAAHVETQTAPALPRSILCALDGSMVTTALAKDAASFSEAIGATLTLLHVSPWITDWPSAASERRLQERATGEARRSMEATLSAAGVDAPLLVETGEIVNTIAVTAERTGADLVMIGRGSVAALLGRLRTHAFGIVQRSPCPVLSL